MNICIVATTIPPVIGGLEVHVWELGKHLARAGHKVFLIGYRNYNQQYFAEKEETPEGVCVFRQANNYIFPGHTSYVLTAAKKILDISRSFSIDIVHAHQAYPAGMAAYLMKKFKNIPYVITSHGQELIIRTKDMRFRPFIKLAMRSAARTIAVSKELKDKSILFGADKSKAYVLANVVDAKRFNPKVIADTFALRKELGISAQSTVILSLRRLVPKTGVQYVVEIAPQIINRTKNVKFLIVGDGSLKQQLKSRVKELKIDEYFIFAGSIPNQKIPAYIAASNFSIFASLAEATSIACLEVMACGRPVIVSNVGGLPEIVEDGKEGLVVDFPRVDSTYSDYGLGKEVLDNLAAKVLTLVEDKILAKNLGVNAANKVKQLYVWDRYIKDLVKIYKEAQE